MLFDSSIRLRSKKYFKKVGKSTHVYAKTMTIVSYSVISYQELANIQSPACQLATLLEYARELGMERNQFSLT